MLVLTPFLGLGSFEFRVGHLQAVEQRAPEAGIGIPSSSPTLSLTPSTCAGFFPGTGFFGLLAS